VRDGRLKIDDGYKTDIHFLIAQGMLLW